jgi:hypothetical protein
MPYAPSGSNRKRRRRRRRNPVSLKKSPLGSRIHLNIVAKHK